MKIIYDVGSNNGDDIPYYLLKADKVIAIEANPGLAKSISHRFEQEISSGKLIVENCVIVGCDSGMADFYIHKHSHVLSQAGEPPAKDLNQYTKVELPSQTIIQLIEKYGDPYYIKIDIEGADGEILSALFDSQIYPEHISAESHTLEIFYLLAIKGGYTAFKLVEGRTVSSVYSNRLITTDLDKKPVTYSFPHHSAGPMGEDIDGDWLGPEFFFRYLAIEGLGWKDIHATRRERLTFTKMSDELLIRIVNSKSQGKRVIFQTNDQPKLNENLQI